MSENSADRRKREKEQRRQDILLAAGKVFAANGFESASMENIASVAEFATGTIYLYFKDKEALFFALVADKISSMVDRIEKAVGEVPAGDPVSGLREAIRAQFEFNAENRDFFDVIMRHPKGPPSPRKEDRALFQKTIKRHHGILIRLVERAQKKKLVREGSPHDYAMSLVGSIMHLAGEMIHDGKSGVSADAKAAFVFDLFMKGAGRKS